MAETTLQDVQQLAGSIDGDLRANSIFPALQKLVDNPVNSKDEQVKAAATDAAFEVFAAIKDAQVGKFAADLTEQQRNVALKYVFKCLARDGANNSALLKWHEQVVELNGLGAIMRSMVDRKI